MAIYYIDPDTGNDSNDGSTGSPWATVGRINQTSPGPSVAAGDTVYLRDGDYGTQNITITKDGTSGNPITIKAETGHTPQFNDPAGKTTINLTGRSYITIDGIYSDGQGSYSASNIETWVDLTSASYCTITNCDFKRAKGWEGVLLENDSHHNIISKNRMDELGIWDNGDVENPDKGDMITCYGYFNLIEYNILTRGGHDIIWMGGAKNVFRYNYFDNQWEGINGNRCSTLTSRPSKDTTVEGMGRNLVYGNVYAASGKAPDKPKKTGTTKVDGLNHIFRHNIMMNGYASAISQRAKSSGGAPDTKENRICHNTIYNIAGAAQDIQDDGDDFLDNRFVNNVAFKLRQDPPDSINDHDIYSATGVHTNKWEYNLIDADVASSSSYYFEQGGGYTLSAVENTYPSNFSNNIETNPIFATASPTVPKPTTPGDAFDLSDFELQEVSPCINTGTHLTKASGSGSSSDTLVVDDASWFCDGFGIISGDMIKVGSNSAVEITNVDYGTDTVTLASAISWNDNDNVSFDYSGTSPDLGAVEYSTGGGEGSQPGGDGYDPQFVDVYTNGQIDTPSLTITPTTTVADGNLMIAAVACVEAQTISTPAGWTQLENISGAGTGYTAPRLYVYSKIADSEPSSYTFNLSESQGRMAGAIIEYDQPDADPVEVSSTSSKSNASTVHDLLELAGVNTNSDILAITLAANNGVNATVTDPSGYSAEASTVASVADPGKYLRLSISRKLDTDGSTIESTTSSTDEQALSITYHAAINGADTPVPPPPPPPSGSYTMYTNDSVVGMGRAATGLSTYQFNNIGSAYYKSLCGSTDPSFNGILEAAQIAAGFKGFSSADWRNR